MSTELSVYQDDRIKPPSTFFFPLRTNVHYFDYPQNQLSLVGRIKQASLLYNTLLFEAGMYQAVVWLRDGQPGGPSMDFWLPPNNVEELSLEEEDQSFKPTEGEASLLVDQYVFANGPVERRYRSQFHSVLRTLNADSFEWIKIEPIVLPGDVNNAIRQVGRADESKLGVMIPAASHFLKDKLLFNLNRDLFVGSQLQLSASMDELFTPMLRIKAAHPREPILSPGLSVLEIAVPDWSHLPWDQIVKLREHAAITEFRKRMVTIERVARESVTLNALPDLRAEIDRVLKDELMDEIESLRVTKAGIAKDVGIDFVLGLPPGSFLSSFATMARGALKLVAENRSWVSPLLKLRDISRDL